MLFSETLEKIHYLTPSAPAWEEARRRGTTTGIGLPFDDDYHAQVLMHEYITVGHIQISANKPRGFTYYSAPSWFYQGLQQYDGMFHSTESNRTIGYQKLLDYADRKLRDTFYSFGSTDVYFGGVLLLKFLWPSKYGEYIHGALLRSEQPTFAMALAQEFAQHDRTVSEAFYDFQRWFASKVGGSVSADPPAPTPRPTPGTEEAGVFTWYFTHSAVGSRWETDLVLLNPQSEMVEAKVEVFDKYGELRTEEQFDLQGLSVMEWGAARQLLAWS